MSPSRSATGGALLAGDPHLPSGMPGVWYEIGLELDGRCCRGASIPGLPGISLGQNNDVAFAFTNVMADVEDLFVERIEDESYEFQGEQRPLEIVEELISIRGQDQPERHEVRLTHHGPIVNEALGADDEQPLALRWAALDEPSITHAHVGVLEPTSGPELVELLRSVTMPVSNLVWADRHGSIGYKLVGRDPEAEGRLPRPAEARLDRGVRVGRLDPLRRAARAGRSRRGVHRHRQQPGRRRRLSPPHHQRLARRLSRRADRAAAPGDRGARPGELPPDADRPLFDPRRRGGPPPRPAGADQPARDAAPSSG